MFFFSFLAQWALIRAKNVGRVVIQMAVLLMLPDARAMKAQREVMRARDGLVNKFWEPWFLLSALGNQLRELFLLKSIT